MKKIILMLLPICLFVGACDPSARKSEQLSQAKPPPLKAALVKCQKGGPKVITIVANNAQFSVAPPHLCVEEEDEIKVNFTGNHAKGVITLKAKPDSDAAWLDVSNPGTNPDHATFTVPQGTTHATYFYTVTADGWGTIDPMISVD
jgi:hypothetical protein